jgi:hypothetical protein
MEIPLTRGMAAQIDDEDWPAVSRYKWQATLAMGHWYAQSFPSTVGRNRRPCLKLHHLIMPPLKGFVVDHKNGDGLDCRRSNLRFATHRQNMYNSPSRVGSTSSYKGASLSRGRWRSQIRIDGRNTHLGLFDTEEEAALIYDQFARLHHGQFARLNFPLAA